MKRKKRSGLATGTALPLFDPYRGQSLAVDQIDFGKNTCRVLYPDGAQFESIDVLDLRPDKDERPEVCGVTLDDFSPNEWPFD